MQLELSAEDAAFREEMRTFFTTKVPQEIRDAVADAPRARPRTQIVESQRILNEAGLAVPHWPVEWGGQDWTPLRRHIWHEEMQRACVPTPLAFNASMVGPVIAAFGSQEQKERFLPTTANLDIWWSPGLLRARRRLRPRLAAHHRGARRRRVRRQRPEDVDHARPVRRLDLQPGPHRPRGQEAGAASRSCSST